MSQSEEHAKLFVKWMAYPSSPIYRALMTFRAREWAVLSCARAAIARQKRTKQPVDKVAYTRAALKKLAKRKA